MSGFDDRYLNFGDVYGIIMQAKTIDQAMNVLYLPYVEMPKWISTSERLPKTEEDGYWFFVTKEENETYTDSPKTEVCMTFFDERNQWFVCSGRTTAWMPIIFPEPYKEQ